MLVLLFGLITNASELLTRYAVKTRKHYVQVFPAARTDLQTLQTAGQRKIKSVELVTFLLRHTRVLQVADVLIFFCTCKNKVILPLLSGVFLYCSLEKPPTKQLKGSVNVWYVCVSVRELLR